MSSAPHPLSLSASAAAPALRSGRISVTDYYAAVSTRFDKELKFDRIFPGTTAPPSLSGPSAAPSGALAGVPLIVSPDIDVGGAATIAGCSALAVAVAKVDNAALAALRGAGAHLLGHATGAELSLGFSYATSGQAKNPYASIGISGGSVAAAVASRIAAVGLVVDVAGSARASAALCGVVAFRPTHGRYSAEGALVLSPTVCSLVRFSVRARSRVETQCQCWRASESPLPLLPSLQPHATHSLLARARACAGNYWSHDS